MPTKAMYWDALHGPIRVIPQRVISRMQMCTVVARVAEDSGPYRKGEEVRFSRNHLVYLLSDQRCVRVPESDLYQKILVIRNKQTD